MADRPFMQVSSASSASFTSGSARAGVSARIEQLQEQLKEATKKLKDVSNSEADAETKKLQTALFQAQIAALQAEIQALQTQQSQVAADHDLSTTQAKNTEDSASKPRSGPGQLIDTYA
jgi:chromosome segregation ATPase